MPVFGGTSYDHAHIREGAHNWYRSLDGPVIGMPITGPGAHNWYFCPSSDDLRLASLLILTAHYGPKVVFRRKKVRSEESYTMWSRMLSDTWAAWSIVIVWIKYRNEQSQHQRRKVISTSDVVRRKCILRNGENRTQASGTMSTITRVSSRRIKSQEKIVPNYLTSLAH